MVAPLLNSILVSTIFVCVETPAIIFRAGGDSSTTYAPSPHYLTSKMRSLYLEGYNYSLFDLTRKDRVQIQVASDNYYMSLSY